MYVEHLSYSSASSYAMCPSSWRKKYVEKLSVHTSANLLFGKAFHSTVEHDVKSRCIGTGMQDLVEVWDREWKKEVAMAGAVDWGTKSEDVFYGDGVRMFSSKDVTQAVRQLDAVMMHPLIVGQDRMSMPAPSVELKFEFLIDKVSVPIIGYIDIIGVDGVPVDLKTSSQSWNETKAAAEVQPAMYLAALNQCGYVQHNGRFRYVIFVKTKTPKVQVIDITCSPESIQWAMTMMRDVWKGIRHGVFPCNPTGWKCSQAYCEYWAGCRGS